VLSRSLPPMGFLYFSRVLECFFTLSMIVFILAVRFFAPPPYPLIFHHICTCFLVSTHSFRSARQRSKMGALGVLSFCRYEVWLSKEKSRKTEQGVDRDGKDGGNGRRNGWEGKVKEGKHKSCSPVHHVL